MKVVILPGNPDHEGFGHPPLPNRGDEIFRPAQTPASYSELASLYPSGWKPDVVVHWGLEYNPIPAGIDEADCLTVGVLGDWNLGGQVVQRIGGAFDVLVADYNGTIALRNLGFENVRYAPQWAYDPNLHRVLPGVERDLDIVMIGNFNHSIQRERARWIRRVARLSTQWNVLVTSGVYGEEYTHLLNRAKIVFNRSIRGEINMRAYEAPACGALMFYEHGNPEIANLFRGGEECVLYKEDDFEALVSHYITHDAERERIARAGHQRVQSETYLKRFEDVLNAVDDCYGLKWSRHFTEITSDSKSRQYAIALALMPSGEALVRAAHRADDLPDSLEAYELRSALCLEAGLRTTNSIPLLQNAKQIASALIADVPSNPVAYWLRAQSDLAMANRHSAKADLQQSVQLLLTSAEDIQWTCTLLPPLSHGLFRTELERIWGAAPFGSRAWRAEVCALTAWRAALELAGLNESDQRLEEAAAWAQRAVELRPDLGEGSHMLALYSEALGRTSESLSYTRIALDDQPLDPELWLLEARLLQRLGRLEETEQCLNEWLAVIDGCPIYESVRDSVQLERDRVRNRRSDLNNNTQSNTNIEFNAESSSRSTPVGEVGAGALLVAPDWNDPTSWQPPLRLFCSLAACGAPFDLALWVNEVQYADIEPIANKIVAFASEELTNSLEDLPNLTLAHTKNLSDARAHGSEIAGFIDLGGQEPLGVSLGVPVIPLRVLSALARQRNLAA